MAYMNQEKKAKIAAALKEVMPKGWGYSLGVRHHSAIVLTIRKAPVDLAALANQGSSRAGDGHADINTSHLGLHFTGELLEVFTKIVAALNLGNFDNSDPMTDYFHVGHYVDLNIGKWDKPFQCTGLAA